MAIVKKPIVSRPRDQFGRPIPFDAIYGDQFSRQSGLVEIEPVIEPAGHTHVVTQQRPYRSFSNSPVSMQGLLIVLGAFYLITR